MRISDWSSDVCSSDLSNLAYPTGLIVSPAAVKEHGKDFGRHPSGTGAFKFEEWEANSRVVVTRNEDYWDGAPPLEAVIYRPITDANTRIAEMLSGGLDVMVEVPPDSLHQFRGDRQSVGVGKGGSVRVELGG